MTKRKELTTGIDGRGNTVWMVVTVVSVEGKKDRWTHIERFDSEAEALNWLKWA